MAESQLRFFRSYLWRDSENGPAGNAYVHSYGIDLSTFSQAQLSAIARQLNERPRKTLNYHTPAETFAKAVATTG